MPNNIAKYKNYTTLLDEVFMLSALTGVLESDASTARQGANANEILIPKMEMDGLGDYDRSNGYPEGDVTLTLETKTFNYERGRMFTIDYVDNEESAGVAYGNLAGEFIRTKVVPEADAFRFATYTGKSKAGMRANGALTDGNAVYDAVVAGITALDEAQVPASARYLFITPTAHNALMARDDYKSRELINSFAGIVKVPQSRFCSAITLNTGDGNKGGYEKASGAVDINFMIIYKPAVIQFTKHVAPKVITPEQNQTADAWKYGYRVYSLVDAYDNKLDGIYVHTKEALA